MLYFDTDSVTYIGNNDGWVRHKADKISPRQFKFTFPSQSSERRIGITYYMHNNSAPMGFFTNSNSINGITGIKYSTIKVNGVLIDKSYLTRNFPGDWVDIAFNLDQNGNPVVSSTTYPISNDLSPEVNFDHSHTSENFSTYFQQASHVHGWLAALHNNHDGRRNTPSTIEVRSIKIFQKINGVFQQLGQTYVYPPNGSFQDGGLYIRYPFFPSSPPGYDYHEPMPGIINSAGILTFSPNIAIDRVWHWWHEPRQPFSQSATDFKIEAEVKITGPAGVLAGIDFQTASSHVGECASGEWYFENGGGWQIITCESHHGN